MDMINIHCTCKSLFKEEIKIFQKKMYMEVSDSNQYVFLNTDCN